MSLTSVFKDALDVVEARTEVKDARVSIMQSRYSGAFSLYIAGSVGDKPVMVKMSASSLGYSKNEETEMACILQGMVATLVGSYPKAVAVIETPEEAEDAEHLRVTTL